MATWPKLPVMSQGGHNTRSADAQAGTVLNMCVQVTDAKSARLHLMAGSQLEEVTMDALRRIALGMSGYPGLSEAVVGAFRAIAYLIDEIHQKEQATVITDLVEKSLEVVLGHATARVTAMEEALNALVVVAKSTTEAMEDF
jgi:hypothetical protein